MKIDVERLKVDAKYWYEVAPSWAKSLLGPCPHGRHYWFDQFVGTGDALCLETNNYRAVDTVQPHAWDVIPRPTTPPAPEWDGLSIEFKDGRIFRLTIPKDFKNGVIKVSGETIEVQQ